MDSVKDISAEYKGLKETRDLPDFEKLAEDFDIEKIAEKETSFLIREIRRAINEKLSAYLNLFETLINPSAPPMFVFSILRKIDEESKGEIKEIYKQLSKIQLEAMKLDTVYDEKAEVEFVRRTFVEWQELKQSIYKLVERFESGFEDNNDSRKNGYFG